MKTVLLTGYGPAAEVLKLVEAPIPVPAAHEVLLEVHASAVNPLDVAIKNGYGKAAFETQRPLPVALGRECSGRVVAVGSSVWNLKVGDEVFAATSPLQHSGMHAEYVAVSEHHVARRPASVEHSQAATMAYAPLTALSAVSLTECRRGFSVLVEGASGGVGSFAVQYLKLLGCHVTGTCSARNVDYVESLGADVVWDYAAVPDPAAGARDAEQQRCFDYVFDFGGGHALPDLFARLRRGGHLVSASGDLVRLMDSHGVVPGIAAHLAQLVSEKMVQMAAYDIKFDWAYFRESSERLRLIAELVDAGKIRFPEPRRFAPEQCAEAFDYAEAKQSPSKAVLQFRG